MRLTTRARYALRMMLDIARNSGSDAPVALASVAERTDLSQGYLEQVATALRNARLLRTTSGRFGGYRLALPAEEITIGQVLDAVIGPVCLVDCIEDPSACPRSDGCECRVVYRLINRGIADVLQAYTLADLLDPSWVRDHADTAGLSTGAAGIHDGDGCRPVPRHTTMKKRTDPSPRRPGRHD